ncbi:thyroid receptor-interacting protein 13 [Thecamonas trahens ATCC 50062]|uniref:Thyroid receptor-interacting protein 13 n=1 Tax=Thecamonas trahens ATCC 50062 TaxID=461836 RepID=A0A0L0DTG2_THETB|nr:thyroid receptor-interacting protein 13 [Thecamonas trahens ATCC 50062]KNC55341.1 thyroid receptor-interacting protein 13 [Thecamonas trahens ATCC 50062]|eukprot:XP_013753062.1 thyroid receptor-interacting protein 13 [Thecamonas trahens ATCC 50062]
MGVVEALLFPEVSEYIDDIKAAVAAFLGFFTPYELAVAASIRPVAVAEDKAMAIESNEGLLAYMRANVKRLDIEVAYSPADARADPEVMVKIARPGIGAGEVYPLEIVAYKLSHDGVAEEMDDAGEFASASHWVLPAVEFDGVWESLVYDSAIKANLVRYVQVAMQLSDAGVDTNLVAFNRVVLLHGPPGTGKTSLCKALAHKLAIRLSSRYAHGQLIEINAHSLFSKWFSESGKLVTRLFSMIRELVADSDTFVVVLIDEVESLTAARTSALAGTEPSDSIRVVNALLTQIDLIKAYPNVAILTTSNITGAIDLAFVDRADIKQFIGLPSRSARYGILASSVTDLMRAGVVQAPTAGPTGCISGAGPFFFAYDELMAAEASDALAVSLALLDVADAAQGLSGRSLRKLPVAALVAVSSATQLNVAADIFLAGLLAAAEAEMASRAALDAPPDTAAHGADDIPRARA